MFIKVTVLQMEKEHVGYIDSDKITSMTSISMMVPAPSAPEGEEPEPIEKEVTIVNIAGQQPMFVAETPDEIFKKMEA